ncbi:aspartokinase [Rhizoctonia solani AG-3 Rhs1AP]|uniref:aspartate kinase n=1 Tax=Rhizoctonia solani AG-3 Rhs1AP TaxID=1086054 RepID=X8J109_9AGAM|nr:aspartokinase [Rhizoctonia solani AG-3 Rhs1AP]
MIEIVEIVSALRSGSIGRRVYGVMTRDIAGRSLTTTTTTPPPMPLLQNPDSPNARWVIQKFGGTSVGKFAAKIAEQVVPAYIVEDKVALVCSARSGSTKALGTTNLLLKAATEALRQPALGGLNTPTRSNSISSSGGLPWSPVPKRASQSQDPSFSRAASPGTGLDKLAARKAGGSPPREPSPPTPVSGGNAPLSFSRTVDLICSEHVTAARELIRDQDLLRELEQEMVRDCDGLRAFLGAAQLIEEISVRSRDSILGVGERLSCKLVAAVLRDRGVDSEFVSLENIVPAFEQELESGDTQLDQSFYDSVARAVGERLAQCGRRVPVVTGFFGPVPGSLLAQIGRGYTDLLAALAAVGTQARELQIWKEVDGIFTADPRKVPTARLLSSISPDEAAELTYYGSEVIHPFTMAQAIRARIPIRIKNVERPLGEGTVVDPDSDALGAYVPNGTSLPGAGPPLSNGNKHIHTVSNQRLPTAVTIKEHIIVLNVRSNRKARSHGFLARVFGSLDRHGVIVDLISTSEVHVSMAIAVEPSSGCASTVVMRLGDGVTSPETVIPSGTPKAIVKVVQELHAASTCTLSLHPGMAILSLVGRQMRHSVGVAGRMFDTLAKGGVNIEMISQGASEINISCVIEGRDAVKALNLIHQGLLQVRAVGAGGKVGPWLY